MNNAIFIIVNSNHFNYTIAFLNSMVDNWPTHPYILCHYASDLTTDQLDRLKSYKRLQLIALELSEDEIGLCPSYKAKGMLISYGKLKVWASLYDSYDNILVMDVDTLVLNPLDELIQLEEFTIFRAAYKFEFKKIPELNPILVEDGISNYFNEQYRYDGVSGNSGIVLIPKKFRTKENYRSMMDILNRYRSYNIWADQAVLNLWMLKNNIAPSEGVKYNFLTFYLNPSNDYWAGKNYEDELEKEMSRLCIVHFTLKPEELLKQKYLNNLTSHKFSSQLSEQFNYYLNR